MFKPKTMIIAAILLAAWVGTTMTCAAHGYRTTTFVLWAVGSIMSLAYVAFLLGSEEHRDSKCDRERC